MASDTPMPGPLCLIENMQGLLTVNREALEILSAISQPVVVVAIVGLYRTGKSYLMNKLAGKEKGFTMGSTVQAHTKGIWMWCMHHPKKPDHTLVLLDTEGLGDVEKGNNQNDCWLFTLAILLSSTFVYNSMGVINQQALDQLHYVTELTERIRTKSSPDGNDVDNSANFVSFFPDFVWTLRDFSLQLAIDGQPCTADQYLQNSLQLKHDDELDSEFLQQVTEFRSYILSFSKTKILPGGIEVTGPRLESLVLTYVDTINSGALPCVENAVLALAQRENPAAVQKALAHYDQQMAQKVQLPTDTLQELLDLHRACEREACKIFFKYAFLDTEQVFQTELMDQLNKKQDEFYKQNLKASSDRCTALLQDIFSPLEEEVKQGIYSKPGGYRLLIQKVEELKKKYYEAPRKGLQAKEVLQKYLQSKEEVANAILQTDQTLTEKEKEIEVKRVRAESAQLIEERVRDMQKWQEQMIEQKEKSLQEYLKQSMEQMNFERAQMKVEYDQMFLLKLQKPSLQREEFLKHHPHLCIITVVKEEPCVII